MKISVEQYSDSDFQEVLILFNDNHDFDTFTDKLLREKLMGDPRWNPETTLLAVQNDKILGFMMGVEQKIRGENYAFIKLMAVDKAFRRKGIATKLYKTLEEHFKSNGVKIIRFYDSPLNYYMPGIDPKYTPAVCFVEKMGFQKFGDSFNMTVDLNQNFDVSEKIQKLKNQYVKVSRASEEDKEELLKFVEKDWLLWQNEIKESFKNQPISAHIAKLDGKIKAFSLHSANNKTVSWFGPMGTHPDMRGKGIGAILLKLCLQDLKEAGFTEAVIPWVAPTAFYSHFVGAKITRVFWRYRKEL